MSLIDALILGIVEGLTEFLPISSTAHLMFTSKLLGLSQSELTKSFEIIIQFGAIFAIFFMFRKRIINNLWLWRKVLIAFIPTAVVGFFLYKIIKAFLIGNLVIAAFGLLVGGFALIWVEKYVAKRTSEKIDDIEQITDTQAFYIGLVQSLAVIPGVSRAGATLVPSLLFNISRQTSIEFSFLLAVPTIAAAAGYDLIQNIHVFDGHADVLAIGFITSFVAAILAIKFVLSFIKHHSFISFGIYRVLIALIFLIFLL